MMKIRFLVLQASGVGGGVRSVVNQANALADRHDVEVVSVYYSGKPPAFAVDPRVRLSSLLARRPSRRHPLARTLRHLPSRDVPVDEGRYRRFNAATDHALRRYLRGLTDGVLVTARPALNLLSARYADGGVVRVGQDHMNLRSYKPGLVEAMAEWFPRLDALVALTEADAAEQRARLGPGVRVERIPNGIHLPDVPPAPLGRPAVVAAGRLTAQKGFDRLVDAFAMIADAHPRWQLHVYGRGPDRHKLQDRIDAAGLGQRVRLMGHTAHLDAALADASMYVLSSRYEGLPMVALEAMSLGLPVVAFDCHTGPRDVVTDGYDGLLVPEGDVGALAAGMARLMDCATDRRRLGAQAQRSVARFDSHRIAECWERLFADLLAREPARAPCPSSVP